MDDKAIEMRGAVKCDNPGCDYRVSLPSTDAADLEPFVGHPCPKCGRVLLTPEDFELAKAIVGIAEVINDAFVGPFDPSEPRGEFRVSTDGTGNIEVGPLKTTV